MRRVVASAVALAVACLPVTGPAWSSPAARDPATAAARHAPRTPIRHLVVMLQEGHTFDNYFGRRTGVDGLPRHVCLPTRDRSRCVAPYALGGSPHVALVDTAEAQQVAVDGGRMDGFVRAQAVHRRHARAAMGYYAGRTLPVLRGLAGAGVVFDRWFSAVPGGPVANDLFAVAAAAPARATSVPRRGWQQTTIFDRLEAAGVPWRIYVEDYRPGVTLRTAGPGELRSGQVARVPVLATPRFLGQHSPGGDLVARHVVPLDRYFADLARGTLPAVSWVVTTRQSEQPPHNPVHDQRVLRAVVNGLIASPAWPRAAFILSYGSGGGWYDHVPPPVVHGVRLGVRVPTVLLSPYARAGSVVHQRYDAASVLRLIEQNWGVAPLGRRDRTAASLLPVFRFARAGARPALVAVADTRPPVAQPDRRVLYTGYLVALAGALGCVALVVRRGRSPGGSS